MMSGVMEWGEAARAIVAESYPHLSVTIRGDGDPAVVVTSAGPYGGPMAIPWSRDAGASRYLGPLWDDNRPVPDNERTRITFKGENHIADAIAKVEEIRVAYYA